MSQRDLVIVLRLALDLRPSDLLATQIRTLAEQNPRSIWSTKVLHNIGRGRIARLLLVVEPRDPDTRARVRGFSNSMRRTSSQIVRSSSTQEAL